jgi:hypothetical protein
MAFALQPAIHSSGAQLGMIQVQLVYSANHPLFFLRKGGRFARLSLWNPVSIHG